MRQHIIPRSYLARWCDPATPDGQDPYVWVFNKVSRDGKKKAPKNLFREKHFYTDRRPNIENRLWLEEGLSRLENEVARIVEFNLEGNRPLQLQDKGFLAAFASAMFVRTRIYRDHIQEQWQRALEIGEELEQRVRGMTKEQLAAMPQPLRGDGPGMSLDDVRELVQNPLQVSFRPLIASQTKIFLHMNCGILVATHETGFITSDAPCVIFDPEWWRAPPMYRGGLGSKTVEITLPLSPRFLVLFGWRMVDDIGSAVMPVDVVEEINRRTRFSCDEKFVVNRNVTKDHWFDPGTPPPDAEPTETAR